MTPVLTRAYSLVSFSSRWELRPIAALARAFLKELKKALASARATDGAKKISLGLAEEAEWLAYFNEQKAKANALQQQIDATDTQIDALVYELYGLTEEEVKMVEGSRSDDQMIRGSEDLVDGAFR